MKILIATGIYPPTVGGPATYSKLVFDELSKRGHIVKVMSFDEVRHLPKVIRHGVYLLKLIKITYDSEIIYAQDPVSVGLPAFVVSKILRKHFAIRVAGDYAWEQACQRFNVTDSIDLFQVNKYGYMTEFFRYIQRFVVNGADVIITPSKYFSSLVAKWTKNSHKVHTIYNGIDLTKPECTYEEARAELKINKSDIIIFSAGRLVPWKGFDVLIQLIPQLNRLNTNFKLIIAGDGPDKDRLTKLIKTSNVRLLGNIPREKLQIYLRASDLFVLNTSFESFSFQVVEAMNMGVPVITTRIGNLEEIVEHDKEGILVEPNNKEEIIDALSRITQNLEYKENLVNCAYKKAEFFTINRTIDNLISLFNSSFYGQK